MRSFSDIKRISVEGKKKGWSSLKAPILGGLMLASVFSVPSAASFDQIDQSIMYYAQAKECENLKQGRDAANHNLSFEEAKEKARKILEDANLNSCQGYTEIIAKSIQKYGDNPEIIDGVITRFVRGLGDANLLGTVAAIGRLSDNPMADCILRFEKTPKAAARIAEGLLQTIFYMDRGAKNKAVNCILKYERMPEVAAEIATWIPGVYEIFSLDPQIDGAKIFSSDEIVSFVSKYDKETAVEIVRAMGGLASRTKNETIVNDLVKYISGSIRDPRTALRLAASLGDVISYTRGGEALSCAMDTIFRYEKVPEAAGEIVSYMAGKAKDSKEWEEGKTEILRIGKLFSSEDILACISKFEGIPGSASHATQCLIYAISESKDENQVIKTAKRISSDDIFGCIRRYEGVPEAEAEIADYILEAYDPERAESITNAVNLFSSESVSRCILKFKGTPRVATRIAEYLVDVAKKESKEEDLRFHSAEEGMEHVANRLSSDEILKCIARYAEMPDVALEMAEGLLESESSGDSEIKAAKLLSSSNVFECITKFKGAPEVAVKIAFNLKEIAIGTENERLLSAAAKYISRYHKTPKVAGEIASWLGYYAKDSEDVEKFTSNRLPGPEDILKEGKWVSSEPVFSCISKYEMAPGLVWDAIDQLGMADNGKLEKVAKLLSNERIISHISEFSGVSEFGEPVDSIMAAIGNVARNTLSEGSVQEAMGCISMYGGCPKVAEKIADEICKWSSISTEDVSKMSKYFGSQEIRGCILKYVEHPKVAGYVASMIIENIGYDYKAAPYVLHLLSKDDIYSCVSEYANYDSRIAVMLVNKLWKLADPSWDKSISRMIKWISSENVRACVSKYRDHEVQFAIVSHLIEVAEKTHDENEVVSAAQWFSSEPVYGCLAMQKNNLVRGDIMSLFAQLRSETKNELELSSAVSLFSSDPVLGCTSRNTYTARILGAIFKSTKNMETMFNAVDCISKYAETGAMWEVSHQLARIASEAGNKEIVENSVLWFSSDTVYNCIPKCKEGMEDKERDECNKAVDSIVLCLGDIALKAQCEKAMSDAANCLVLYDLDTSKDIADRIRYIVNSTSNENEVVSHVSNCISQYKSPGLAKVIAAELEKVSKESMSSIVSKSSIGILRTARLLSSEQVSACVVRYQEVPEAAAEIVSELSRTVYLPRGSEDVATITRFMSSDEALGCVLKYKTISPPLRGRRLTAAVPAKFASWLVDIARDKGYEKAVDAARWLSTEKAYECVSSHPQFAERIATYLGAVAYNKGTEKAVKKAIKKLSTDNAVKLYSILNHTI